MSVQIVAMRQRRAGNRFPERCLGVTRADRAVPIEPGCHQTAGSPLR